MHFDALRLIALRKGGRIEEALATENARKIFAETLTPRSSLLLGQAFSALPFRSANWLDGPCLVWYDQGSPPLGL